MSIRDVDGTVELVVKFLLLPERQNTREEILSDDQQLRSHLWFVILLHPTCRLSIGIICTWPFEGIELDLTWQKQRRPVLGISFASSGYPGLEMFTRAPWTLASALEQMSTKTHSVGCTCKLKTNDKEMINFAVFRKEQRRHDNILRIRRQPLSKSDPACFFVCGR